MWHNAVHYLQCLYFSCVDMQAVTFRTNKEELKMARGQQKIQSQQKAQAKTAAAKKQAGHNLKDQKKAAAAALNFNCSVCKVSSVIFDKLF